MADVDVDAAVAVAAASTADVLSRLRRIRAYLVSLPGPLPKSGAQFENKINRGRDEALMELGEIERALNLILGLE